MRYIQPTRSALLVLLHVFAFAWLADSAGARECPVRPFGLIGERWLELDGADGPLGCPAGDEFGVEGQKDLPGELSGAPTAIAGHAGRLFLAWKGSGNDSLNLMLSNNGGISFESKMIFGETSDRAPALVSDGSALFLAWKERDENADEHVARHISLARVSLFANTAGTMGIEGLGPKILLAETTEQAPALAIHQGRLFLAWIGVGNRRLNLAVSTDGGRTFAKLALEPTSDAAPALASTPDGLVLAWKDAGGVEIMAARVVITGNTAGGAGIEGLAGITAVGHQADGTPALAFHNGRLFLGWKGVGNASLNLAASAPGSFAFVKRRLEDGSDMSPSLASSGKLWMSWRGFGNKRLNVASAILIGNTAGDFGIERLERIAAIKRRFENGEIVWSPAQGPRMMVAGYRQDGNLIVNWGYTNPFAYDSFVIHWTYSGDRTTHAEEVKEFTQSDYGFFRLPEPGAGDYSISVEGCAQVPVSDTTLYRLECPERTTVPVDVNYQLPVYPPCAGAPQAGTPIGDRWIALNAQTGPLGCPTDLERTEDAPAARIQSFAGGEIAALPSMGPRMTLAVYRRDREVVAEWSEAEEEHALFQLSVERDGESLPATELAGGTGGRWSLADAAPGTYRVHLQGCPTGAPCSGSVAYAGIASVSVPAPPVEPACNPSIPIGGLIGGRWQELGGAKSRMGCPVAAESPIPGEPGIRQMFEHGSILLDQRRGPLMLVAAYQEHNNIVVKWGSTLPDRFDTFRLHMSYNGIQLPPMDCDMEEREGEETCYRVEFRAQECVPQEPCSAGEILIEFASAHKEQPAVTTSYGTGRYEFRIEGCEDGDCGGLNRTAPVVVEFRTAGAGPFLGDLPVPRDASAALEHRATRTLRAAELHFKEEKFTEDVANYLAYYHVVDVHAAQGWDPRDVRRPGRPAVPVLAELDNALRVRVVTGRSGTNFEGVPEGGFCKRTGEYDTVMKSYIPMLYRYGRYIAPDARYRLLHLLNKTGPYNEEEEHWSCLTVDIPESENHLWLINSARYLTNQLWAKRSADPRFDNRANGLADRLLVQLQGHLAKDFIEYNARPYTRYTWMAIQNIYDFAEDARIRAAAQSVLDYVVAKGAVSTSDGRRNPPFRRLADNAQSDFFSPAADRLKKSLMVYMAPTPVMDELFAAGWVEDYSSGEMVGVGSSSYRPPNLLLDLTLNPDQRMFFQRFAHHSIEIYASEPDYVLVAGGTAAKYSYTAKPTFGTAEAGAFIGVALEQAYTGVIGAVISTAAGVLLSGESSPLTKKNDRGFVQPTYLVPTGEFTTLEQMIRFAGTPEDLSVNSSACVLPRFACGQQPIVPALYLEREGCSLVRGDWTFIDFASDRCRDADERDFGFFVAVHGAGRSHGILEVLPKRALGDLSLRSFADGVIGRNRGRSFGSQGEHEYVMTDGRRIRFVMGDGAIVLSAGRQPDDATLAAPGLAAGTIVNSDGAASKMTIRNRATGELLLLDLTNAQYPERILFEPDPLRRLLTRGVVHSVPEAEIREWLGNIHTPYPALAAAIERDFPEGGLSMPVDIDVVRWFYEEDEGAASPRRLEDVDRQALENALISAHNSRYGHRVTRIEQIRRGPPAPVSARSPVELAFDVVARFNRAWSQANTVALQSIEPMYASSIDYYGDPQSRDKVLEAKRDFATRWPVRDYHFRPDPGASSCDPAGACLVKGTVEWYAAAPERGAISIGSSEVSIGVATIDGALIISSEDSHVTRRLSWP